MTRPRLLLPCLVGLSLSPLALAPIAACGDHDALAPDQDAGSTSHSSSRSSSASSGAGGGGGATPVEPDGPTKLTLVDGVVDAPAVAFCFAAYPSGEDPSPPTPPGGLAFGRAHTVALPSADLPAGDALLSILTGDLTSIGGATCAQITADPGSYPSLVVSTLGVLPSSTLGAKRSLLVAPIGCLGGAGHEDPKAEDVCGKGYTKDSPSLTLLAAPLSRLDDPARVAIQAVNGTTALKKIDVYLQPGFGGAQDHRVAQGVPSGAAEPFPPFTGMGAADIGSVGMAQIGFAPSPSSTPMLHVPLADALAAAGLSSADVLNGKGFAIVAVGAAPAAGTGAWWNALSFVVVSSDP